MAYVVYGVSGLHGAGKTQFLVRMAYRMRRSRRGREVPIWTNIDMVLPYGPPVVLFDTLSDLIDAGDSVHDGLVLIDEIQNELASRSWAKHGEKELAWFSQIRKRHLEVWYTTQSMGSVDKLVRDRTHYSLYLESFRKLGFFFFNEYFKTEAKKANRIRFGWYLLNPFIASCYNTDQVFYV